MGQGKGADRVEVSVNQDAKAKERLQKLDSIMLLNIARKFFCRLIFGVG